MENKLRADLFLKEITPLLKEYTYKWQAYFKQIGLPFDQDVLSDTIVKCYDTISRLGLKDGQKESMNYLFKAFKMNSLRELEYARNKNKEEVEDINVLYETYMSNQKSEDYKIAYDLWIEFQFNYILRQIELYWDKQTFYLFKLKYVLNLDDEAILKKSKNKNWKKDIKYLNKWLKANIDKQDIVYEFNIKYPDIDLDLLSE